LCMDAIIKKVGCEYISDYVQKRYLADKITVSDIAVELGCYHRSIPDPPKGFIVTHPGKNMS